MRRYTPAVVLAALLAVAALGGGTAAHTQQSATYAIEQGNECTEIEPISNGSMTVEEFYGYPENPSEEPGVGYSANMPLGIEEQGDEVSSLFLYQGPRALSLVVVHGGIEGDRGGAATFVFSGLPEDGEWAVQDDPEDDSVERWNETSAGWTVDWGWWGAYTDGGAFEGLGEDFEVTIDPAFNEGAHLEPLEPGEVTTWRALSATDGSYESVDLDLDEPVTVRAGSCS